MEQSVHIYRPLINHEELYSHYETQDIFTRLITPSQFRVSLVYTMRKFDHTSLQDDLLTDYYVFPRHARAPSGSTPTQSSTITSTQSPNETSPPTSRKHGSRRHTIYGSNRVLALELTSPPLSLRQATLSPSGLTFFEIEDYKPHIVLDFNLPESIDNTVLNTLQVPEFPLYFHSETLVPAITSIRTLVTYRSLT